MLPNVYVSVFEWWASIVWDEQYRDYILLLNLVEMEISRYRRYAVFL